MNGYEMDVLSLRKASKLKNPSSRKELNTTAEVEGNQQEGLKSTAKYVEVEAKFIQDVAPQPATSKHAKKHVTIGKIKPAAKSPKRKKKETTGGKGGLEDILQVIDIAETPCYEGKYSLRIETIPLAIEWV